MRWAWLVIVGLAQMAIADGHLDRLQAVVAWHDGRETLVLQAGWCGADGTVSWDLELPPEADAMTVRAASATTLREDSRRTVASSYDREIDPMPLDLLWPVALRRRSRSLWVYADADAWQLAADAADPWRREVAPLELRGPRSGRVVKLQWHAPDTHRRRLLLLQPVELTFRCDQPLLPLASARSIAGERLAIDVVTHTARPVAPAGVPVVPLEAFRGAADLDDARRRLAGDGSFVELRRAVAGDGLVASRW